MIREITQVGICETRAKRLIPGQSQLLSKRSDRFSQGVWPGYYSKAKGVEVWDVNGTRYIDMSIGGMGATILGYADPDVDAAVIEAIGKGVASSLNCPEELELADVLCDLHPWADMARFTRSGGEAMAVAVRIARAHTKRDLVAVCGYHGWHDWYLAANLGETSALDGHLLPGLEPLGVPSVLRGTTLPFKFNDLESLVQIVNKTKGQLAAIVLEPVRHAWADDTFYSGVGTLAHEAGAVVIVDEISSGFRLNTGGAHRGHGPAPDLAVFAKALGNGYPIAAVIGKGHIMKTAERCFISSTNWTERTGPVAALAMIEKHRWWNNQVPQHLMAIGQQVQAGWRRIFAKHGIPVTVKGLGPISQFSFDQAEHAPALIASFVEGMLGSGFLASPTFYAMYAHQLHHVEAYLDALESTCVYMNSQCAAQKHGGLLTTPERYLRGQPAVLGFGRLT